MSRNPVKAASDLLRELRTEQGKSLRTAASELGIDASILSRIERGERPASESVSKRLAEFYGVTSSEVALATGRIPQDVIDILLENPELIDELRCRFGSISALDNSEGSGR